MTAQPSQSHTKPWWRRSHPSQQSPTATATASTVTPPQKVMESNDITSDSIYLFYSQQLYPAFLASLPLLGQRLRQDASHYLITGLRALVHFLLPPWSFASHYHHINDEDESPFSMARIWEQYSATIGGNTTSPTSLPFSDFMLRFFDSDGDGHINRTELLNMTELLKAHFRATAGAHSSWWAWFSREWPLMDWKVGLFLWRSFGGILLALTILSVIPGRLHAFSARILRWPVLALTYFLITVELMVYVVIRLAILTAEWMIAVPKHRRLRRRMAHAVSYSEWYSLASELDRSQKRDRWLRKIDDELTSQRYNWGFVLELLKDLKNARATNDSFLAMAVLQQCTRKNVGGVMSEDLFSYSNSGEPKHIVAEFVQEVTETIRWITDEALKLPNTPPSVEKAKEVCSDRLQREVGNEKDKLWKSLIDATLFFLDPIGRSQENSVRSISNENVKLGSSEDDCSHGSDNDNIDSSSPAPGSSVGSHVSHASQRGLSSQSSSTDFGPRDPFTALHRVEVLAFLKRARAAYGRTALCLSGGAMMGLFHFGHLLGLLETGTLPHIVSGTSAGSAIGALICTRTNDELRNDLNPEVLVNKLSCFRKSWSDRFRCLWQTGHMFTFDEWHTLIKWFTCGDMTFEEAYKKTGRVLCITLSSTTKKAPPVLINYLTAPNVTIASAVVASAAVPGLVPPVRLQYKTSDGTIRQQMETYFDGSIRQDIPLSGLAEMLNCQFFVVCQANPHIVPFFFGNKGSVGRPSRWSSGTQESSWRGGFLLTALEMYLKNDMKAKFVFLKELEAAVGFTSTLMTQEFVGTTTIVPQVSIWDYFRLFRDPALSELYHYFQRGAVASYGHVAMIKVHYSVADVLDECVAKLEGKSWNGGRRRPTLKLPDCRLPNPTTGVDTLCPPSILRLVLGSDSVDQMETVDSGTVDSREDEYTRDWIDID